MDEMKNYQNYKSDFEIDCAIIRALKSGEMHNWFVAMRNSGMTNEQLCERHDFIKSQGTDYREKIDKYNEDIYNAQIRRYQVMVYLAEQDPNLKSWPEIKKMLCYEGPKKEIAKLNLYPVTKETYERIKYA